MNPGAMKESIRIYSRGDRKDASGYFNPEKQLICEVRARRADATTREVWEGYAAKVRNIVNFQIRPRKGLKAGMWVECDGLWHEIIAIQHGSYLCAPMTLKTICKEAI